MTIYVYKEDYEEPEEPVKAVLTPAQRTVVKTKMQQRVDSRGKVPIRELVLLASEHSFSLGLHFPKSVFIEIALEIRTENGVPEVPEIIEP